jgi:nickel transport protein
MGNKWKFVICLTFLLIVLGLPTKALAHGVDITYTSTMAIEIVAAYDTGEPMSDAQVVVYAPDDPSTAWLTGVCDDEGHFSFTPDNSKPGSWDVQIRKAGHGGMVHIPVGEDTVVSGGTDGYSVLQIVLMAACVAWGIAGTALYVSRRRT